MNTSITLVNLIVIVTNAFAVGILGLINLN